MQNILYQFIEVLKMSLAHSEQETLHSNSNTTLSMHHHKGKKYLILYAKQPMENRRGPTPDEKPH